MQNIFDITDFGAIPNSDQVQTKTFQNAIDACFDSGGGTVRVPEGKFVIGSIILRSNIKLFLKSGAILLGSTDLKDYQTFDNKTGIKYLEDEWYIKAWHLPPYYFQALICGYDSENITIAGETGSLIDGQDVFDPNGEEKFRGPMGMVFSNVKGLNLKGYTVKNSSNWSHTIESCTNVAIDSVQVYAGHDGFDLHHSDHIKVTDCVLKTGDDCFAGYDVNDLEVKDSWLNTSCNQMRIGGSNIVFKNCSFIGPGRFPHISEQTYNTHAMFKYYAIKADRIRNNGQNIRIENSNISNIDKLITYQNGNKNLMQDGKPLLNLTFSGTTITGLKDTSVCYGNGKKIELLISDCKITPPEKLPFLLVDDDTNIQIKNVFFTKPTVFKVQNKDIVLEGFIKSIII